MMKVGRDVTEGASSNVHRLVTMTRAGTGNADYGKTNAEASTEEFEYANIKNLVASNLYECRFI